MEEKLNNQETISIVTTLYNEESIVDEFINEIDIVVKELDNKDIEIILVDNGSTDKTFDELTKHSELNKNIKIIKLIRNFGIDGGLRAGIEHSKGDATILMHGDLQDDPKLITEMVKSWEDGNEQVLVRYLPKKRENLIRKIGSYIYYKWAAFASENLIIYGVSDFRLISKNIVESLKELPENINLLRGILIWPGYKYSIIDTSKRKRVGGISKIDLPNTVRYFRQPLALSAKLLYVLPLVSIFVFFISITFILSTLIYWLSTGNLIIQLEPRLTLILVFNTITIIFLGILGVYVAIIFEEIKRRPNYIVEKIVN